MDALRTELRGEMAAQGETSGGEMGRGGRWAAARRQRMLLSYGAMRTMQKSSLLDLRLYATPHDRMPAAMKRQGGLS